VVWRDIGRPRLLAMGRQLLGQIHEAAHPSPSWLPFDHYPACFRQLMFVVHGPATSGGGSAGGAAVGKDDQLCRAVPHVWRVISALANLIPLADTLASAFLLDADTRARMHVTSGNDTLLARLQQLRDAVGPAAAAVPPLPPRRQHSLASQ